MHHRSLRSAFGSAAALAMAVALATGASLVTAPVAAAADFPSYDSRYHTYAEMVAEIKATQAAHPDIVQLRSIGKSYQGRDLWVAKVSDNVATDEPEPEVMFDSLHHAREHLSLEQTLAILRWLTPGLRHRPAHHRYRQHPRDLDRVRGQPRRRRVRPDRLAVPRLAQEPPAERRHDRDRHRHQSQLRLPLGVLRRVVRVASRPRPTTARAPSRRPRPGPSATSWPAGGSAAGSRSSTAITFHTAGEQILWPYGYTATDVPSDMTTDDHAALVALGKRMAATNGYTAMQSSSLYVTDGDEIDWAYGVEHIFMYTFEMYPSHSRTSSTARFYPADELIAPQTERNRAAILMLIEAAGCPYAIIGKARTNCGPLYDTFETAGGWVTDPLAHRHGDGRRLAASRPGPDQRSRPGPSRPARGPSSPERPAGTRADSFDVDGGVTTIRSAPVALPAFVGRLTFRYYVLARLELRRLRTTSGPTWRTPTGFGRWSSRSSAPRPPTCRPGHRPRSRCRRWAGQTVRIVFAAADLGSPSTIEAAVDDVRIIRPLGAAALASSSR